MNYSLIKKRVEDAALLRIEQLAREKERLDFECVLERKLRLVAHALRHHSEEGSATGPAAADLQYTS